MLSVSIWLIPQKDQEVGLRKIIDNLSSRYDSFSFIPHITIYHVNEAQNLSEILTLAEKISQNAKVFAVNLEKVSYSDMFTKTLYAQYEISPDLQSIYEDFKKELSDQSPYEINPHLSLIYKNNMDSSDKNKEIKNITAPKKLILDRIAVITRGGSIEKEKDVLEWKSAAEFNLKQ